MPKLIESGLVFLFTRLNRVLEWGYIQFPIKRPDTLPYQFVRFEMDGVDGLVIDTLPKCLKFLFLEIRVEWVRLYGSLVVDFRKLSVAEDTAYQGYYLIRIWYLSIAV